MAPVQSRLLVLPPELRNRIYDFVFHIDITSRPDAIDIFTIDPSMSTEPGIIKACRQLRADTLGLYKQTIVNFWSTNYFRIEIDRSLVENEEETERLLARCAVTPTPGLRRVKLYTSDARPPGCVFRMYGDTAGDASESHAELQKWLNYGALAYKGPDDIWSVVNGRGSLDLYKIVGTIWACYGLPVTPRSVLLSEARAKAEAKAEAGAKVEAKEKSKARRRDARAKWKRRLMKGCVVS